MASISASGCTARRGAHWPLTLLALFLPGLLFALGLFLMRGAVVAAAGLISDVGTSTLTGRRIGVYQILVPIGAGGMGEVYRARDTRLGRDVAIKILPREFTAYPDRLTRFEREARVLASLNHPNIAAIYDLQETDGSRYLEG